ncbi:MAG TPA: phosphoribosyltransferase family protein [Ardenticatenaceae bacterium]|nr:phosphoribosyltransferase family protein [Ardenticatenaceae bacterium]
MSKDFHSWERIDRLAKELVKQLKADDWDAVLAVTRGGMIPGCLVSELLNLRNVLTAAVMFYTDVEETLQEPRFLQFPSDPLLYGKRILIVDDVWDSGRTAMAVKQRVLEAGGRPSVAVIHFKPARNAFPDQKPEYYVVETSDWIVYPWDPDRERLAKEEGIEL